MGIFDRLGRIARSEVSELKRVLREAREEGLPDPVSEEAERDRLIAEAEAELARAEEDVLGAEIDAGAALWGRGADGAPASGEAVPGPDDPELSRGADLWARAGERADPAPRATSAGPISRTEPRPGRAHAFPREVRAAYAALELPLGAPRDEIDAAYRRLVARYHPDRHAQSAHLQSVATELTVRIREARDLLLSWLDQG